MASYIANDMRVGWVIAHNGKRYSVMSITKVKPGKGGAFVQADLRDIDSGNKGGDRWRAEDKVEKLMVEDFDCQYLYSDGSDAFFMNLSDYEQFTMPVDIVPSRFPVYQRLNVPAFPLLIRTDDIKAELS